MQQETQIGMIKNSVSDTFIGKAAKTQVLQVMLSRLAPTSSKVLLLGPSGSGKEVAADALHKASKRQGKMASVNCAAIPAELLESELFGHEKGAFTGADKRRIGLFEQANDGTVFLDEIGDMPFDLQAKLLRVIETRSIRRVGGDEDIPIDFRLVLATHQDLQTKVENGQFREDLYFRIAVFPVRVPPLSERTADIPLLMNRFMAEYAAKNPNFEEPIFSLDALRVLANYNWPGNVRELRNVVERSMVLFSGQPISSNMVMEYLIEMNMPELFCDRIDGDEPVAQPGLLPRPEIFKNTLEKDQRLDLRRYLRDIEIALIESALAVADGNVSLAAENLGLQRTTLIEKMKKMDIARPL